MIVVCRKVATLCFLETGLELLFYAMCQARTVRQSNLAQRHVRWGHWCSRTGWSLLWRPQNILWQLSLPWIILAVRLAAKGAAPACQLNKDKTRQRKLQIKRVERWEQRKRRGRREKKKKKIKEKENLMGNSINQYCVLWNVLKSSYFWSTYGFIHTSQLTCCGKASVPERLLLYNRTTHGECSTQVFDGWTGWKFI